jgi:hypothetical protein
MGKKMYVQTRAIYLYRNRLTWFAKEDFGEFINKGKELHKQSFKIRDRGVHVKKIKRNNLCIITEQFA